MDVYDEAFFREYQRVVALEPGWGEVLDRYDVRWVIYPTESPLVRQLASAPDRRVVFRDRLATVLLRDAPVPAAG